MTFDLAAAPLTLSRLLDRLRATLGINIVVNRTALDECQVDPDTELCKPVTVRDMPAGEFLKLVLAPVDLVAQPTGGHLAVTSREWVQKYLVVALYPAVDLIMVPVGDKLWNQALPLRELIINAVARDEWDENNGESTIDYFPPHNMFVIRASPFTHEEVAAFLAALREARRRHPALLRQAGLPAERELFGRTINVSARETPPPDKQPRVF